MGTDLKESPEDSVVFIFSQYSREAINDKIVKGITILLFLLLWLFFNLSKKKKNYCTQGITYLLATDGQTDGRMDGQC